MEDNRKKVYSFDTKGGPFAQASAISNTPGNVQIDLEEEEPLNKVPPTDEEEEEEEEAQLGSEETSTTEEEEQEITTSAEDEEEGEEDEDDEGEEGIPNIYTAFAQEFKKAGLLPDDFDAGEEVDGFTLYSHVKAYLSDQLTKQAQTSVQEKLKSEGVDKATMDRLYLLSRGYDESQLKAANVYQQLASYPDDAEATIQKQLVKAYHSDKQYSNEDSDRIISNLSEEELVSEYTKSRKHFATKRDAAVMEEQKAAQAMRQQEEAIKNRNKQIVENISLARKLGDTSLSVEEAKDLQKALYSRTEKYEVDGSVYDATPYQVWDHKMNNDVVFRLKMFKQFRQKDLEIDKIKERALEETENSFLAAYDKRVKKAAKSTNKKPKSKNQQQKTEPGNTRRRLGTWPIG